MHSQATQSEPDVQWGCLLKAPFSGKTYAHLEDVTEPSIWNALNTAYNFWRDGSEEPLSIFSINMTTGVMHTHYTVDQLLVYCAERSRDEMTEQDHADNYADFRMQMGA